LAALDAAERASRQAAISVRAASFNDSTSKRDARARASIACAAFLAAAAVAALPA